MTKPESKVYIRSMSVKNIKEEAKQLLDKMPDNLTWDELMYQIHVRQCIEAGLADGTAGKRLEVQEVRERDLD